MENPIKIDDLGVPLFLQTPISTYIIVCFTPQKTNKHGTQKLGDPACLLHIRRIDTVL